MNKSKKLTDEELLLRHIYETYKPSETDGETNYWYGAYNYYYEIKDYVNPFKL